MSAEKLLAALGLVVCAFMLIRVSLGKWDRPLSGGNRQATWRKFKRFVYALMQWPSRRRIARQMARDVILRAQTRSTSRGQDSVHKPEAFGGDKSPKNPPSETDVS